MSEKRLQVKTEIEEENHEVFAQALKNIMSTSPENRGPAAQAIMSTFQVYFAMIGGVAARSQQQTR